MLARFKHFVKTRFSNMLYALSPRLYFNVIYYKHRGKLPNLKAPKDLSEIIFSEILSGEIDKYAVYADKVRVRDYIAEWGFAEYLPKLYGVWDSADKIDFSILPNAFALKVNNGCGSHCICKDKRTLDEFQARELMRRNLKTEWGKIESLYSKIPPLCFAEEFIDDGNELPYDYKFMCCDGVVKCILCCVGRGKSIGKTTYNARWEKLDYTNKGIAPAVVGKPKNLNKMLEIASVIASKFKHVRVDMYSLPDGRIFIGELTFTPAGGVLHTFTNEAILACGHSTK